MNRRTNIIIRLDEELKRDAEALFSDLGMSLETAISVFIRQSVRLRGLPFRIRMVDDPFYSKENLASLRHSIAQFERGEARTHDLIED